MSSKPTSPLSMSNTIPEESRSSLRSESNIHEVQEVTILDEQNTLTSKGGPDEATFMTGLLNEERDKTIKMYEDLNVLVDMIDTHFDHVLERHELDFMNAYKGHMVKV